MNRVEPEKVLNAYIEHDLVPIVGDWVHKTDGKNCACALSALGTAKCGFDRVYSNTINGYNDVYEFFQEELGYDKDYIIGFISGFDKISHYINNPNYKSIEAQRFGYEDGVKTRNLIEKKLEILDANDLYDNLHDE